MKFPSGLLREAYYFAEVWQVAKAFLFRLPAEQAHALVFALAKGLRVVGCWHRRPPAVAPRNLWGLTFAHPVGLAAGLDKDAQLLPLWAHLGFAFVEVGTVTPRPQPGNPRPRLFRIPQDKALLNRMGFNNQGAAAMAKRLEKRPPGLIVGINIGKNRDTPLEQAHEDYGACMQVLRDYGDFFVVNVSSPNTPGLRALQQRSHLQRIFDAIQRHNNAACPVLLKLSPDLSSEEIEAIGSWAKEAGVAGFVAGNTTTQVQYPHLGAGGVSGAPLRSLRRRLVQALYPYGLPIIGTGGILAPQDAEETFADGASLIELYTGLIYEGPGLLRQVLKTLSSPAEGETKGKPNPCTP